MAITFEQFLAVRVAIEDGADRADALRRHQLTAIQWRAGQRRWLQTLKHEAQRGGRRHVDRYRAAFSLSSPTASPPVDPAPAMAPMPSPAPHAPIVIPMPAAMPSSAAHPDVTAVGVVLAVDDEPLPFRGASSSAPPLAAAEAEAEAVDMVGETGFVSALTDEELGLATPFETRAPTPEPPEPNVDETAFIGVLVIDDDPLPFSPASSEAAPAPAAIEEHDMAGHTAFVPALTDDAVGPTELSIEQYASLRADIDRSAAESRAQILARYALESEDAYVALKRSWTDRFREAPGEYGKFRAAYDTYSRWLVENT